jgi:hypothetical protein
MVFVDAVVEITASALLLHLDTHLEYEYNSLFNLNAWLAWGVGFQLFTCLLLWRQYQDNLTMIKLPLSVINEEVRRYDLQEVIHLNYIFIHISSITRPNLTKPRPTGKTLSIHYSRSCFF